MLAAWLVTSELVMLYRTQVDKTERKIVGCV